MIALMTLMTGKPAAHRNHVMNRVAAKAIDLVIVLALGVLGFYPFGPLIGFAYSLLADSMNFGPFAGQSVGKKLMKLRVIDRNTRGAPSLKASALRNAPVGVATFFAIIPVWGWLISPLIGFPMMLMEIYLMLTTETGHRLGDVMGQTEVVVVSHVPSAS